MLTAKVPGVLCIDRVVPALTITSPAAGNVAGTATIAATATDNDQIASVQFRMDGNIIGTVTAAPFQMSYDTHAILNGAHTITAIATDRVGNQTTRTVAITVVNQPAVNFYSPGNGATVSGNMTLAATVTQYSTGVTVWFYVNGNNIYGYRSGNGTYSVAYDTHYLAVGWNTITVIAQDDAGQQTRIDYSVYVNNSAPGAGVTLLGDHCYWDGEGWDNYRHSPPAYDGTGDTWIWSNTGAKFNPVYLPGNPDPTHYQMRVWCQVNRIEGGSDGNVCYLDFQVGGVVGWTNVWANGPAYTNIGPLWNVNGGNDCYAKWWCSSPGWNTCFCIGIGFYYDFVVKSGYAS